MSQWPHRACSSQLGIINNLARLSWRLSASSAPYGGIYRPASSAPESKRGSRRHHMLAKRRANGDAGSMYLGENVGARGNAGL